MEQLAYLAVFSYLVSYFFAVLQWLWLHAMRPTIWESITPTVVLGLLGATFIVGCVGNTARPYMVLL